MYKIRATKLHSVMNIYKKTPFLILIFISVSLFAQTDFKNTPKELSKSCKSEFISKINSGEIALESLDYQYSDRIWEVFSDRSNNLLYNTDNGRTIGETLDYMQPLYVKTVRGQWLQVYSIEYEELGWIKARNLVLSKYSLLTNNKVSIPLKKIIITSIDELRSQGLSPEDAEKNRNFYTEPSTRVSDYLQSVQDFEIYFVIKEQDGSVLLANNDVLTGNVNTNKSIVKGWIPRGNTTAWDTRLMLEPARSPDAMLKYDNEILHGFHKQKQLEMFIDNRIYKDSTSFIEFEVGPIPYDRMRKPVINSINSNIKQVVSISKDTQGDIKNKQELKRMMRKLEKQQQHTNIIFVVDATLSMSKYFKSIARSIRKIMSENQRINKHELQFGVVVYRDYADKPKDYETLSLTSDIQTVTGFLNSVECKSKDNDLPEAQFNGIINGLNDLNVDPEESNIMVLIGDCGNHAEDQFSKSDVANVLDKFNMNVISFQVDFKQDPTRTYMTFNKDVQDFIKIKSNKITENRETELAAQWKRVEGKRNSLELSMVENENDFVNTFGRFIYSKGTPMEPGDLEGQILSRVKEYMNVTDNNLVILRKGFNPKVDNVPAGLLLYIMDSFNLTRNEALEFLRRNEVTSKAYVAIDYNKGVNALEHVVFMSEKDYRSLKKQLNQFRNTDHLSSQERKVEFEKRLISICKNIIGSSTESKDNIDEKNDIIESLTMNEVWKLIFGIEYKANKEVKTTKLYSLASLRTKTLKEVIDDFEDKCGEFGSNSYFNSDEYQNREMEINGNKFYWIPIEDLPGTTN